METKRLKIIDIKSNPNNPRLIKDDNFRKLVQSLKDFPEMADVRPIVVNMDNIILGGNMRFKAMQTADWKEVPVIQVDWPEDKQREFVIKDNVSGGDWDWDTLANEWDAIVLDSWGLELPGDFTNDDDLNASDSVDATEKMQTIVIVAYNDINDLDKITEFYNLVAIDITDSIKEDLNRQRKVYVYKK